MPSPPPRPRPPSPPPPPRPLPPSPPPLKRPPPPLARPPPPPVPVFRSSDYAQVRRSTCRRGVWSGLPWPAHQRSLRRCGLASARQTLALRCLVKRVAAKVAESTPHLGWQPCRCTLSLAGPGCLVPLLRGAAQRATAAGQPCALAERRAHWRHCAGRLVRVPSALGGSPLWVGLAGAQTVQAADGQRSVPAACRSPSLTHTVRLPPRAWLAGTTPAVSGTADAASEGSGMGVPRHAAHRTARGCCCLLSSNCPALPSSPSCALPSPVAVLPWLPNKPHTPALAHCSPPTGRLHQALTDDRAVRHFPGLGRHRLFRRPRRRRAGGPRPGGGQVGGRLPAGVPRRA